MLGKSMTPMGRAALFITAWLAAAPLVSAQQAPAQQPPPVQQTAPAPSRQSGSTTLTRSGGDGQATAPAASTTSEVRLEALLTSDGQRIDQGLVWRIFNGKSGPDDKPKLIATHREASPTIKVPPGD